MYAESEGEAEKSPIPKKSASSISRSSSFSLHPSTAGPKYSGLKRELYDFWKIPFSRTYYLILNTFNTSTSYSSSSVSSPERTRRTIPSLPIKPPPCQLDLDVGYEIDSESGRDGFVCDELGRRRSLSVHFWLDFDMMYPSSTNFSLTFVRRT